VVISNDGYERLDDGYVRVEIPELGLSTRGYFGDLVSTECDSCDNEDSVQKTVYLKMPENAQSGTYDMQVRVYNADSETSTNHLIQVGASEKTRLIAAVKNQDVKAGESVTYEVILVNSGDDLQVFNMQAVSGSALDVSVPSVVTVGPESSKTVQIQADVSRDAAVGSYTFTLSANGEEVTFGANVTEETVSNSVLALTVVLVVIFVVLLIVLIVLLTRKGQPEEEVETSYY
ncbi:MAG: hypothetical protein ACP5D2_04515, partial [Candidatus Nanoarchaeia archaeon]